MKRSAIVAMLGLLIGGLAGCVWAYALHRVADGGNLAYFPIIRADGTPPASSGFWQYLVDGASYYFQGVLFGMGFGAVTGAIIGAAGAIVQALRTKPAGDASPPPPKV